MTEYEEFDNFWDDDDDDWDDEDDEWDYCYECGGYGDDYYIDDDGELVCRCPECTLNPSNWEDGYWIGDV